MRRGLLWCRGYWPVCDRRVRGECRDDQRRQNLRCRNCRGVADGSNANMLAAAGGIVQYASAPGAATASLVNNGTIELAADAQATAERVGRAIAGVGAVIEQIAWGRRRV